MSSPMTMVSIDRRGDVGASEIDRNQRSVGDTNALHSPFEPLERYRYLRQ